MLVLLSEKQSLPGTSLNLARMYNVVSHLGGGVGGGVFLLSVNLYFVL